MNTEIGPASDIMLASLPDIPVDSPPRTAHRETQATGSARSLWVPTPVRLGQLLAGLWLFGTGEGCLVHAGLGSSPWTVLAQGAARQLVLGIGVTTVGVSLIVLLAWIPLRQRPGLGTVLNAVLIGAALGVMLPIMPTLHGDPERIAFVALGIAAVATGSGLYLTTRLGPGPRDGLMTGLHHRTGRPLGLLRTLLESAVVVVGFLLGGTVGVGTLAFALMIGPGVQSAVRLAGGLGTASAAHEPAGRGDRARASFVAAERPLNSPDGPGPQAS